MLINWPGDKRRSLPYFDLRRTHCPQLLDIWGPIVVVPRPRDRSLMAPVGWLSDEQRMDAASSSGSRPRVWQPGVAATHVGLLGEERVVTRQTELTNGGSTATCGTKCDSFSVGTRNSMQLHKCTVQARYFSRPPVNDWQNELRAVWHTVRSGHKMLLERFRCLGYL